MSLTVPHRFTLFVFALLIAGGNCWSEDVRYLNFSVKNRDDIYLRDLRVEELVLEIDGKPVEVGFFGYKEVDTAFVVLLENSSRTAPYSISMPQWGQVNPIDLMRYQMFYGFFPQMTERGSVLLGEFGREIRILQDFTSYPDLLTKALSDLQPESVKRGINDPEIGRAIGRGVDWLRDRREKRRILIFFTTNVDRESYGNMQEYQDMLREVDIELYVISFAAARPSGVGIAFEEKMNRYFFKKLVGETAGWLYIVGDYKFLDELFTDLKGRLNNNYTVGFYVESDGESGEHEVRLEVLRDKCRVTHRKVLVF